MKWFRNLFRRQPKPPNKWLSWYKTPITERLLWLAKCSDGEGYWYSPFKADAYRFDAAEDALKPTPVYDGSAGIIQRTGVIAE